MRTGIYQCEILRFAYWILELDPRHAYMRSRTFTIKFVGSQISAD